MNFHEYQAKQLFADYGIAVPAGVLIAEGLHGRLAPDTWTAMKSALDDVRPLADTTIDHAAGRAFWDLPDDEFSVLAEPGTVGAALRQIGLHCAEAPGVPPKYVAAALHHRRPDLFPLLVRTTRWQLLPHVREGDSGVEAVIHRELRHAADAFARLEDAVAAEGLVLARLRLHDVLLWLSATLRFAHAVAAGSATARISIADATRVGTPLCSSASCTASALITVASMPM